jgi:PAS domain S-box-containing protein
MFSTLVHPEDWASVQKISQSVIQSGADFQKEYRHIRPGGAIRWLETRGTAVFENGVLARLTGITSDVTGRKKDELELRESQTRFKNAFELSAIGTALVSPDGHWLQANRHLCQLLGYSEVELRDLTFQQLTHSDDLQRGTELLGRALKGELESFEFEKRYWHRDGNIIWTSVNVSLVRDEDGAPVHFISQIQDITARKQAESDLRASEARKAAILETSLDCIITFDAESRILEWNPAAESTFGYSRQQAIGARLNDLIVPPELGDGHYAGIEHWAKTGEGSLLGQRLELPAVRADGTRITVEMAIVPIVDSGPPLFTGHLRDISERRVIEERLRLLESVVVNANDAILVTEAEPIDLPGRVFSTPMMPI